KQQAADQSHRRFQIENSDFLAYVSLWDYFENLRQELSQNQLRKQCKKEFLSYLRLREWRDVHHQLRLTFKALNLKENTEPANHEAVHRALLSGLLGNLGFNTEEREYLGARNRKFFIFPGSALRSEERRVGKECRSRWPSKHLNKNNPNIMQVHSPCMHDAEADSVQ